LLNERLLDEVSTRDSISLHFQHKLTTADFDRRVLTFDSIVSGSAEGVQVTFDLCIGADGSYSNVRRQMMRVVPYVIVLFPPLVSEGFSEPIPKKK
jgi:kynurenine 3-monooxygenase